MIRTSGLVVAVLLLAAAIVAARAPLSVFAAAAPLSSAGVSYVRAEGSLWRGVLHGVRVNGHSAGDVEISVRPLALARGRAGAAFQFSGDGAAGRGVLEAGLGGGVEIRDAVVIVDLQRFAYYFDEMPFLGRAELEIATLAAGPEGCRRAEGRVRTDALKATAQTMRGTAPDLAGDLSCEDGSFVVALDGAEAGDAVSLRLALDPDLAYDIRVSVQTAETTVASLLPMLGFEEREGGFVYSQKGVLAAAAGAQS